MGPGLPRVKANWSEVLVSSVLGINLTSTEDFRTFTCSVQNISSSSFTLWRAGEWGPVGQKVGGRPGEPLGLEGAGLAQSVALSPGLAGHVAAVLASLLVLLVLLLAALLYAKCRLNVLLWYQDTYGEVEMNGAWGADAWGGGVSHRASLGSALGGGDWLWRWGRGGIRPWRALERSQSRKGGCLCAAQEGTGPAEGGHGSLVPGLHSESCAEEGSKRGPGPRSAGSASGGLAWTLGHKGGGLGGPEGGKPRPGKRPR